MRAGRRGQRQRRRGDGLGVAEHPDLAAAPGGQHASQGQGQGEGHCNSLEVRVEDGLEVGVQVGVDAPGWAHQLGQAQAQAAPHPDSDTRLHAAGRPAMTDRRQPPPARGGGRFGPPPGGSPRGSEAPRRRVPTAASPRRPARSAQPRVPPAPTARRVTSQPAPRTPAPRRPDRPRRRGGRPGPRAGPASRSARSTDGCATASPPCARCCSSSAAGSSSCRASTTATTPARPRRSAWTRSTLHAMRGAILDRDGTPLAYTSDAQDITADPSRSTPARPATCTTPRKLAPLLGTCPRAAVVQRADPAPGSTRVLATALSPVAAQQVDRPRPARHLHPGHHPAAVPGRHHRRPTSSAPCTPTAPGAAGIESAVQRRAGRQGRQP